MRRDILKNNRFRFLTVLIVPLLIFMLAGTAFASGKSYSVPYAHFDAVLNADGSADITETWTVRYSGEFSRFYKDITYQNTEEKFSDVEILGVKINGNACEPTDDTAGRPDYHYNLSSGTGTRTLTAYLHTTGTTEYEFRYRLKDAVKQVDEDYYIFSYRYIGANFEQSVSDISVTVTAPDKCVMKTLYYTSGTENVDETSAVVSGGSGKGVFKVKVRMDAPEGTTLFTHAAPITAGQLENPKNENSSGFFTFLTVMFFILTVMSLFFLPIVLWGGALNEKRAVRGSSKPSKNRLNKAKKDPAYVENTLRAMRSAMPDPLQFAAAVRGSGYGTLFFCALAQMQAQGVVRMNMAGKEIVWDDPEPQPAKFRAVLNLLDEILAEKTNAVLPDDRPYPHMLTTEDLLQYAKTHTHAFSAAENMIESVCKTDAPDDEECKVLRYIQARGGTNGGFGSLLLAPNDHAAYLRFCCTKPVKPGKSDGSLPLAADIDCSRMKPLYTVVPLCLFFRCSGRSALQS